MRHDTIDRINIDWHPDKNSHIPVYRQIIEYIQGKVYRGEWSVGMRLPSQRDLAVRWEVNRSTVSSAMNELISRGLLETNQKGGTTVANSTWSLMLGGKAADWNRHLSAGRYESNFPVVQVINNLEPNPDYAHIGLGTPPPEMFPREDFRAAVERAAARIYNLEYAEPRGLPELRNALSRHLASQGINADPASILITSGSIQAMQLISMAMLGPGSTIYSESPSYLRSFSAIQLPSVSQQSIPMDSEGLEYWHIAHDRKNLRGNMIYTIPGFHNPTGVVMSDRRRNELIDFCNKYDIPVIEDGAYDELWFEEPLPPSLKSRDENGIVLYTGTFSKVLAPGLRLGWLVGPELVIQRLADLKMQTDYGASSLSQMVATEFLTGGTYDSYISSLRIRLRERRDIMLDALERYLSGKATWYKPSGGFYIWLTLSGEMTGDKLFRKALERKILIYPGSIYRADDPHTIRLSFAYEDPDVIDRSIRILGELID